MVSYFFVSLVALLPFNRSFAFTLYSSSRVTTRRSFRPLLERYDDDSFVENDQSPVDMERRNALINVAAGGLLVATGAASFQLFMTSAYTPSGFQRLPNTQFIAALGNPKASSGNMADQWGLWRKDPGPRGVFLRDYEKYLKDGVAPVGWTFDPNDWWLEEHGIIMENPTFPLPPGRYLVTGGRSVTTGLTIDQNFNWKLDSGTLYDVTHLPCRSARYTPTKGGGPTTANLSNFPVMPGAEMPQVPGCSKQDYAVLFLVGKAI